MSTLTKAELAERLSETEQELESLKTKVRDLLINDAESGFRYADDTERILVDLGVPPREHVWAGSVVLNVSLSNFTAPVDKEDYYSPADDAITELDRAIEFAVSTSLVKLGEGSHGAVIDRVEAIAWFLEAQDN